LGSGPGVGSLKVSGVSMRPSPTDSHGVEVSKLRKALLVFKWEEYLESFLVVLRRHVSFRRRNGLQCIQSMGNLFSVDANVNFIVHEYTPWNP
jgi:hypothetical protein